MVTGTEFQKHAGLGSGAKKGSLRVCNSSSGTDIRSDKEEECRRWKPGSSACKKGKSG